MHKKIILLVFIFSINTLLAGPVHDAARNGNLAELKKHIAEINAVDEQGNQPIHIAALSQQMGIIEFLLTQNVPIDTKNGIGQTALHLMAIKGTQPNIKKLLDMGAGINCRDTLKNLTPLHTAIFYNNIDAFYALLAHESENNKLDINLVNGDAQTPLHFAIQFRRFAMIEVLFDEPRTQINLPDGQKRTPFILVEEAYFSGFGSIAPILNSLVLRLDIDFSGSNYLRQLNPSYDQVQFAFQVPILPDLPTGLNLPAPTIQEQAAQASENKKETEQAPQQAASAVEPMHSSENLLAKYNYVKNLKLQVPAPRHHNKTELSLKKSIEKPQETLDEVELEEVVVQENESKQGVEEFVNTEQINTRLSIAAKKRLKKREKEQALKTAGPASAPVKSFSKKDLDEKLQDLFEGSSVNTAPLNVLQKDNTVKEKTKKPKKKQDLGNTPLHLAILNKAENVHELINAETVLVANNDGNFPLHYAAIHRNLLVCQKIIALNVVDINAENNNHLRALDYAIKNRDIPIIDFLCCSGANEELLAQVTMQDLRVIVNSIKDINTLNSDKLKKLIKPQEQASSSSASSSSSLPSNERQIQNFYRAIDENDYEHVKELYGHNKRLIYAVKSNKLTPLHQAVCAAHKRKDKDFRVIQFLIERDLEILFTPGPQNLTSFHFAINLEMVELCKYLLTLNLQHAKPFLKEVIKYYLLPLETQFNENIAKIVKLVLAKLETLAPTQIEDIDIFGAIATQDLDVVQAVFNKKPECLYDLSDGFIPLHLAISQDDMHDKLEFKITKFLAVQYPDSIFSVCGENKITALDVAIGIENFDICKYFISLIFKHEIKGALFFLTKFNRGCLERLEKSPDNEFYIKISELLNKTINFLKAKKQKQLNLLEGSSTEDKKLYELFDQYRILGFKTRSIEASFRQEIFDLISPERNLNIVNNEGETYVHIAAAIGDVGIAHKLITNGAAINLPDKKGNLPIHFAATYARNNCISLTSNKETLNAINMLGNTALHQAAGKPNEIAIRMLIGFGANTQLKNRDGLTPLLVAVNYDQLENLNILFPDAMERNKKTHRDILEDINEVESLNPDKYPNLLSYAKSLQKDNALKIAAKKQSKKLIK
ncbi:MAG: ankyrin repeat domain-containing protein [Candidatus Babeliales bacterium]|nr:ankyrin repeat domain-containing protein [Candidatus Babeliales bacterium]